VAVKCKYCPTILTEAESAKWKLCSVCRSVRANTRYKTKTPEERFWAKVNKAGECWLWEGTGVPAGYGTISIGGIRQYTHRVAWQFAHGPIPAGMLVCHTCDNPRCVREDHLFLGTVKDNSQDMLRKGRHRPYAGGGKNRRFTPAQVCDMRRQHAAGERLADLVRSFGGKKSLIWNILHHRIYRDVGDEGVLP
jgi:hypothetical protein